MKLIIKNWGLITIIIVLVLTIVSVLRKNTDSKFQIQESRFWEMQSIDTVKYSRDVAGQYLEDQSYDSEIEEQVKRIAETGATHIALGTPYDKHFVPFLKRWVDISRRYNLKVWFRGNFSGWEKWFDYKKITREEHKKLLTEFIKDNGNLFEDGDYFTSCTECENGGDGDPRMTGDIFGFRQFLIDEYQIAKTQFRLIDKDVTANYFPMNYDVASLIMDKETTKALGGVAVIDHYVGTPERTNDDIDRLAQNSGGKIVIGEFGAPIPDIHGEMTEEQQSQWINDTFFLLHKNKNLIGINYWTAFGGSTKLWNDDMSERQAVSTIKRYYSPNFVKGYVVDETGKPISDVEITLQSESTATNKYGQFIIPILEGRDMALYKDGYYKNSVREFGINSTIKLTLRKINPSIWYDLQKLIYSVIISP